MNHFKLFSISISSAWLLIFAFIPITLVIFISVMSHSVEKLYTLPITLESYRTLFDPLVLQVFLRSVWLATLATTLCLLISYPFAYFIAAQRQYKSLLLLLVIIPFWTSSLIRTYAIMAILKTNGLLNTVLLSLGLIQQPLQILYSNTALIVGLVYTLLPFMILPLYANMDKLDHTLLDAARDLGANRWRVFRKILLPMTMPGILSGTMLVFLPAMTLFYLPSLLGGARSLLLGNLIQNQFLVSVNWPAGAATSTGLLLIMLLMMVYYWRHTRSSDRRDIV